MKRKISAVLLALGLTASVFSMGVYAAETETDSAEQVTEAVAEEPTQEAESEAGETEAAETEVSQEDQLKSILTSVLSQVSGWTDEQIDMMLESDDASSVAVATNWNSVKEELGAFEEVVSAEVTEDGYSIIGHAKYEKINDKTDVIVTYTVNAETQAVTLNWDVDYPLGTLMQRAAMNTVMGVGIVFLALLFLSWMIGKLHYIPDMIENRAKKNAPAPAPAPAPTPAPAPVQAAAEEDLTDDLELVAVITAAIAASENTSSDGFVVRSIRKSNKKNWQRA